MEILYIIASVFLTKKQRLKRTNQAKGSSIFAVSLKEIEEALRAKKVTDPKTKLPKHYWKYLHVFDKKESDTLASYRPGVDH